MVKCRAGLVEQAAATKHEGVKKFQDKLLEKENKVISLHIVKLGGKTKI